MEIIIDDQNYQQFVNPIVDGERKMCSTIPRDYSANPHGSLMYAKPFNLTLIPRNEWQSRLDAINDAKAQLSDIRKSLKLSSTDQNGKGFCWAHSPVSAALLLRAKFGMPFVDLSAYSVACPIKNFRDEGGWNYQAVERIASDGVASSKFWPQQSMSRANDNAATWANARLHRFTDWLDLDPDQMVDQMVTCLLLGYPLAGDFNWWGHSVCISDLVSINPLRVRIWNSWGDSWSEDGMGILEGSRAEPNAAIALKSCTSSVV